MFSSDDQNIDICHKYSPVDRAEIPCNNTDTSKVGVLLKMSTFVYLNLEISIEIIMIHYSR
jgi:hypothetical protein